MKKRVLGIDFGSVRVGFALSDPLGITAQGIKTLDYIGEKQVIEHIRNLIETRNIGEIVLGLPLNMDGSKGAAAKLCEDFGKKLQEAVSASVVLWDERLTTKAAERQMLEFDFSRRKRRKAVDRMAAQILLQSYLDSQAARERQSGH